MNESYTPVGRGFDSFFGFYDGGQSYFTHITPYSVWRDPTTPLWWTPSNFGGEGQGGNVSFPLSRKVLAKDQCGALVDLANDTLSASGNVILRHADASCNGTHSTELLATQVIKDIGSHDLSRPIFAYVAWHAVHDPLEVPAEYTAPYATKIEDQSRRTLAGMISNLDEGVVSDCCTQRSHSCAICSVCTRWIRRRAVSKMFAILSALLCSGGLGSDLLGRRAVGERDSSTEGPWNVE